jgi:hypothetical protein
LHHPEESLTQEYILNQLNSMPLEVLQAYVESESKTLKEAESHLEQKRSKGLHKIVLKAQNSLVTFDRFLTAYSGIVDILQGVDAQYGGVASATLSLPCAVSLPEHSLNEHY